MIKASQSLFLKSPLTCKEEMFVTFSDLFAHAFTCACKLVELQNSMSSISPYLSRFDSHLIEIKINATVFNSCSCTSHTHTSHRYFKLESISTVSAFSSYLQGSSISSEDPLYAQLVRNLCVLQSLQHCQPLHSCLKMPTNHLKHLLPLCS